MKANLQAADAEILSCDQEPIRIPGAIQPHGILLTLGSSGRVLQVSANIADRFDTSVNAVLHGGLAQLVGAQTAQDLKTDLTKAELREQPTYLRTVQLDRGEFHVLAHCYEGAAVLEFEPTSGTHNRFLRDLYPTVSAFIARLGELRGRNEVLRTAADEIRELTGFDRVLVYEFDEDWNGAVTAESRNDVLPSYLDLRFPASDIPSQARELYRLNPIRLIPDVDYEPVPIFPANNPVTGHALDLGFATLRSVSPIHRQYMRNMGTAASMSVSILRNGQLWGLFSCHNQEPKFVPFDVRRTCEFIGQVVSVQVEAHEQNARFAERVRLKTIESRLLAHMARHDNFAEGLLNAEEDFLEFAEADGAAVLSENQCVLIGLTPREDEVRAIVDWISKNASKEDIFFSDHMSALLPQAANFADVASGILAMRISTLHDSYVLWFRPEIIQTVRWSGEPSKAQSGGEGLQPRKSFELWKQIVRSRSQKWSEAQVQAAFDLRNAVVGIVLRKAEEMAELTAELKRSNQELEAFSYSVSHDLRAPFRHIVGYAELLKERQGQHLSDEGNRYLRTIIDSAQYAGMLVDNLLNFSRIARTAMTKMRVNLDDMVREVQSELGSEARGRSVEWKTSNLPEVVADPVLLRLAVRNLFSNALKYTRIRENALIEVGSEPNGQEYVFHVRDNGVGFDMRFVGKLFGVFQRLHRLEEFEGTGIGLANVRRIIERHGGRTWAEGELGKGATFYFSLPTPESDEENHAKADSVSGR